LSAFLKDHINLYSTLLQRIYKEEIKQQSINHLINQSIFIQSGNK